MMSLSGLDLALWDLLGKRLAVPVAQLSTGSLPYMLACIGD